MDSSHTGILILCEAPTSALKRYVHVFVFFLFIWAEKKILGKQTAAFYLDFLSWIISSESAAEETALKHICAHSPADPATETQQRHE